MSGEISLSQLKYTTTNNDDLVIGDPTNPLAHTSKYIVFQTDATPGFYGHPYIKCYWDAGDSQWHLAFSMDGLVDSEFARLASNNIFTANNSFYGSTVNIGSDGTATLLVKSTTTFNSPVTFNSAIQINGDFSVAGDNISLDAYNVDIKDKLLTLNHGGSVSSGFGAGISIEEAGASAGFIKTSADRLGWMFKAPGAVGTSTFTFPAADQTFVLPEKSGTIALLSDLISNTLTIVCQEYYTFLSTTFPYDIPHIQLFASGGTSPYTWSIVYDSDTTWTDAVLSSDTISGSINAPGMYSVKVHAIDPNGVSSTKVLRLEISNAGATGGGVTTAPTITNQDLYTYSTAINPSVTPYAFNIDLTATGGVPPYTWEYQSGTIGSGAITGNNLNKLSGTVNAFSTLFTASIKCTDTRGKYSTKTITVNTINSASAASIISFTGATSVTNQNVNSSPQSNQMGSKTLTVESGGTVLLSYAYTGTVTTAAITSSTGTPTSISVLSSASGTVTIQGASAPTVDTVYTLTLNGSITDTVSVTVSGSRFYAFSTLSYFRSMSANTKFAALANVDGTVEVFANAVTGSPVATITLTAGNTYSPGVEVAALYNDTAWKPGGSKYNAAVAVGYTPISIVISDIQAAGTFIHGGESASVAVTATTTYIFVLNRGLATESRSVIVIQQALDAAPTLGVNSQIPTNPMSNTIVNGVAQFIGTLSIPQFPLKVYDSPILMYIPEQSNYENYQRGYNSYAWIPLAYTDATKQGTVVMRKGSASGQVLGTIFSNGTYQPLTGYAIPSSTETYYYTLTDNSNRTASATWTFTVSTTAVPQITLFSVNHPTVNIVNGIYDYSTITFTAAWTGGGTAKLYANNVVLVNSIAFDAFPYTIASPSTNTLYKIVVTGANGLSSTSNNVAVTVVSSTQNPVISSLTLNQPAYSTMQVNNSSSFDAWTYSPSSLTALATFVNGTGNGVVNGSTDVGAMYSGVSKVIQPNALTRPTSTSIVATITSGATTTSRTTEAVVAYQSNFNASSAIYLLDNKQFNIGGGAEGMKLTGYVPAPLVATFASDPTYVIYACPGSTYNAGTKQIVAQGTMSSSQIATLGYAYKSTYPPILSGATTTFVAKVTSTYTAKADGHQYTQSSDLGYPGVSQQYTDTLESAPITTTVSSIYSSRPSTYTSSGNGTVVTPADAYDAVGNSTGADVYCYKTQSEILTYSGFPSHTTPSNGGTIMVRGSGSLLYGASGSIKITIPGVIEQTYPWSNSSAYFATYTAALTLSIGASVNISSAQVIVTVDGPTDVGVPNTWVSNLFVDDIIYVDGIGNTLLQTLG